MLTRKVSVRFQKEMQRQSPTQKVWMRVRDCGFMGETQSSKRKKVQSPAKRRDRQHRNAGKAQDSASGKGILKSGSEASPLRAEQTEPRPPKIRTDADPEGIDKAGGSKKVSTPVRPCRPGTSIPFLSYKIQSREVQRNRSPKIGPLSPLPLSQTVEAVNDTMNQSTAVAQADAVVSLSLKSPSRDVSQASDASLSRE